MAEITLTSDITVRCVQQMGGDHMVVAAAKVSTCGEEAVAFADPEKADANKGLINFLMKHRHGTPWEHSALTFFVHAPIFVFREWHRHRIGHSYNEESARYKPLDPVFWVPRRDRRMCPVEGWKPGRPKFQTFDERLGTETGPDSTNLGYDLIADNHYQFVINEIRRAYKQSYASYRDLVDRQRIALEVARTVLPVGIYSSCWVTVNPRSLMAFLSLRTHEPDATFVSYPQAEIEEAARACEDVLKIGWPLTHSAFCSNGRVAP